MSESIQNFETKFWQALENLFVGAEIEGKSGYVNLLKAKSKYFSVIKEKLMGDIEGALVVFPDFREELYTKLYSFFHRYFSESGSIYFSYTPLYYNVYERVYEDEKEKWKRVEAYDHSFERVISDKEDVSLFWKTHMLYYVKTDRIIRSMTVEVDGVKFFFDASSIELKKGNEKKETIYSFEKVGKGGTIVLKVIYAENGRKTKANEILKQLKANGIRVSEETLNKAIRTFEKQAEVDYFISKDASKFLKEQFDLWMYQYIFSQDTNWSEKRIKELQVLKRIAYKVIDFISQFEDELRKIWEKPRFAFNSNYVITLDRIASREGGIEVVEKILRHGGLKEQMKEWKDLGIVKSDFQGIEIIEEDPDGKKKLSEDYKFLPVDTKYFKDIEVEILALFDNLDHQLDGWLIKSENWQALNTILPKFKEKVQTIYIDPPFNKEQDADYYYTVKFKDSTWITMLENRISLGKELLNKRGSIFVRCDYNGNMYVRLLMNKVFGEENFRNEIVVNRTKKIFAGVRGYNVATDSLFFYSKDSDFYFVPQYKQREGKQKWINMHSPGERRPPERIILGRLFYPPKGRHWTFVQERIAELERQGRIRIYEEAEYIDMLGNKVQGMPQYLTGEMELLDSSWTDIPGYSQICGFPTENSEILLKRVIESTSKEGDLVMDFFLGSGTTTAVAHKLKRKWIGVEMGEHFYTVVLPRMKKVLFYDKSGISKEKDVKERYNEKNAGGFFKYYELEQYEDILRTVDYQDVENPKGLFDIPELDVYQAKIFLADKKLLRAVEIDRENNKVRLNLGALYPGKNVDVAETLSNVTGKGIKKITMDYVEFDNGSREYFDDLDYKEFKPLLWWE
ncbi:site-specific DNA-methyltransferase [Thermosediminibacter oceani]|uniref:DNA methylase N-4/N-6 domain protein n=1 Tax=Thermosediminibacter oceani (strain ATCC BAA-1034 / DSM 16646 / JW/IW-1228P) TaxID=555079 RepID=D9RY94_THEOJ|nr:site-specific DNA-methyltransferase [Thermosediminibacter oceani]ADL08318.1 DNA methylase N-4/N-6 domain protein [Thermosediminibacter oceani DSM 16646]